MRKVTEANDVNGNVLGKGDLVSTLGDNMTAKIGDLCIDMETEFVLLRPQHRASAKGIWHPADQVLRISAAKKVPV